MRRTTRLIAATSVALAVVAAGVGCSSSGSGATSGGSSTPGTSGDPAASATQTLMETKCSMCHTLDRINSAKKDKAGWTTTVARMRENGAVLTDEEAGQIIDYLASR